jgi:hypothetical protein
LLLNILHYKIDVYCEDRNTNTYTKSEKSYSPSFIKRLVISSKARTKNTFYVLLDFTRFKLASTCLFDIMKKWSLIANDMNFSSIYLSNREYKQSNNPWFICSVFSHTTTLLFMLNFSLQPIFLFSPNHLNVFYAYFLIPRNCIRTNHKHPNQRVVADSIT